ncbi:periplasmic sensor hybrid histidine kinase [Rhodovulum sp. PH10]|uniref:hybrid sensor histidine kinase/response regulator n=1 Tax=Rhodovulum sp. PH10 TaxID=1187851 RepID=UPI00027C2E68|nr:hybrid sensor histidine kinase/response regulator [Rhodovulum sp. PH10]EJW09881.1 periplasmic sensor hybrid histidine kinase [Rhodovulum sp. PH10]
MTTARRGTLRILGALMVGSLLVPAALFAYAAWREYDSVHEIADDRIDRAVDVLHEQALKVLNSSELVADELIDTVSGMTPAEIRADEDRLQARLHRITTRMPQVQSIWIIGPDGVPLVTSYFAPAPRAASLADREFFRAQLEHGGGTYISAVFTPRLVKGPSFFAMSRRITRPDGSFGGIVVLSHKPEDFEKFYAELARGPGDYFALARKDGALLARYPGGAPPDARLDPGKTPFVSALEADPARGLFTAVSPVDGRERRLGYRRVEGFPVYVLAGVETATIRAEWLGSIATHLVFGLPATLLLFLILWYARHRTIGLYAEADRRAAAEAALRHGQRLEAVGRLTGGVAHDFNNLLMVILGSAERLRRMVASDKEQRLIEMVLTAARRGETLTRQLLSFSRQQAVSPHSIDLTARIPELSELIRHSLAEDISVTIEVPGEPLAVKVDAGEFEVAVLNICVNARDAMPNGGRLVIGVAAETLDDARAIEDLRGEFAAISFADSGDGIPPDLLPRVFEPFFTTKEPGKGTGLGLSQVYGFCRQAGGAVTVGSRPGEGTVVTMYLPRVAYEVAQVEPAPVPETTAAGRSVLVVEDNPSVAEVCRSFLDQLGFGVAIAASPKEALTILDADDGESDDRFHLVLSDILMPGGASGLDLARELRTRHPGLPVILMTGFSDKAAEVARDGFPVLRKPFDLAALQRELTVVLTAGKAA